MSKRTFWIGLAAVAGALLLLPALLVGLLAIANGLTTGNEQLVGSSLNYPFRFPETPGRR